MLAKIQNADIAQKFNEVADLLEIEGANPFRIRAYRNAAKTLLGLSDSVSDTVREHGDLSLLPGIGKDLSAKITEIVETGHMTLLDQIKTKTPSSLLELLKIPGLGPKRVHDLYKILAIKSPQDLQNAVLNKKILELKGFGEKTLYNIIESLDKTSIKTKTRILLNEADEIVNPYLLYLKKNAFVKKIHVVGSYRRRQETIGDVDILIGTSSLQSHIHSVGIYFLNYPLVIKILSHGITRYSVVLRTQVQIDLLIVPEESYGAALLYFTGSKAHNIALRKMALQYGYRLNEYGLYSNNKIIASREELDIYQALKLPYIEPELRENQGEIEAALQGKLPQLLQAKDLKGDLHIHTLASDGNNNISDMVTEAQKLGYSYLAITDHSKHLGIARGLDKNKLLEQINEINLINSQLDNFTLFKSSEIEILTDGRLDYPDDILAQLDFTVCAIHSNFKLSKEQQTQRILRAMENKYFRILAHPTGRLIHEREPYSINIEKIIRAAAKLGRILEINSQPQRMDLAVTYCRMAKDSGVKMVISTDSHNKNQLVYMNYGVGLARRAWLEKKDVINTFSTKQIKDLVK